MLNDFLRSTGPAPDPRGACRPVRLALVVAIGTMFLGAVAPAASAQSAASAASTAPALLTSDAIAQLWEEAVALERASWDLDDASGSQSYTLALEAAARFATVTDWFDAAASPELEPYRHVYWRVARSQWLAADSLDLSDLDGRRRHLGLAIAYSDRGLAADPDCAACMLWKFNAMGRLQQSQGLLEGARNVSTMAALLDRAIALQPDYREGDRSSTLGNLHYASAIFYRVLPDWFWLKWILGVRGDKERAMQHALTAVSLHENRLDYRVEVGSQLLCIGATRKDPAKLAEGREALAEASVLPRYNADDEREIAAAHIMIAEPKKACSYAGAEWIEIDESGAVASMK